MKTNKPNELLFLELIELVGCTYFLVPQYPSGYGLHMFIMWNSVSGVRMTSPNICKNREEAYDKVVDRAIKWLYSRYYSHII